MESCQECGCDFWIWCNVFWCNLLDKIYHTFMINLFSVRYWLFYLWNCVSNYCFRLITLTIALTFVTILIYWIKNLFYFIFNLEFVSLIVNIVKVTDFSTQGRTHVWAGVGHGPGDFFQFSKITVNHVCYI